MRTASHGSRCTQASDVNSAIGETASSAPNDKSKVLSLPSDRQAEPVSTVPESAAVSRVAVPACVGPRGGALHVLCTFMHGDALHFEGTGTGEVKDGNLVASVGYTRAQSAAVREGIILKGLRPMSNLGRRARCTIRGGKKA